jgi:tol-pal system protein YbgF
LSVRTPRLAASVLCALVWASQPAHAQIFPDNEARRALVELREKQEADRRALSDQNAKLAEQIQVLQRNLLDMNQQIEQLKSEVAKQRGANEQLARDLSETQRKQRDLQQVVDEQKASIAAAGGAVGGAAGGAAAGATNGASPGAGKPAPVRVTLDGKDFTVEPDEKKEFEDALQLMRNGNWGGASSALVAFQKRWPASGYTDASRYWHGNALYGKRDYKESIAQFKAFVAGAPDHPRVPEAMLASANAHLEMKDTRAARTLLNDVIKQHPKSEAAVAAKERLASLR